MSEGAFGLMFPYAFHTLKSMRDNRKKRGIADWHPTTNTQRSYMKMNGSVCFSLSDRVAAFLTTISTNPVLRVRARHNVSVVSCHS